jgi:signal transduction histidine kinase/ligand-binding sensor domain-containing protein
MFRRAAKRMLCWLAPSVALAAGFPSTKAAVPNYFTRTWQVEKGLPHNKVTAVVQTHDGYLWVGTYCGLARFDGIDFTVFDDNNTPVLRSSRITSLFEADDGALWIGTESGDVCQYREGIFSPSRLPPNRRDGKIYAITADDAGDVWLLNEAGELTRERDGKVLSPAAGLVSKVVSLARGRDKTIWVNRDGVVSSLQNGKLTVAVSTNYYVQGFCAARDGGLWVASNGGIRKWREGSWVANLGAAPWGWAVIPNIIENSEGVLEAGTANSGLWLVFPGQTNLTALHVSSTNGLPSDWIISLCEDREKSLWCGTGAGLAVVRQNNIETISPPDKWKGRPVLSVLPAPDGALWVGTEGAGLYRLQNGAWTNFDEPQGIRNSYIWSLASDSSGKIWAGTWGGGLFMQADDSFHFAPGIENVLAPMPALLSLHDELWIGTTEGAIRYRDGKAERFNEIAGQPFGDLRAIGRDKSGALWFGTAGKGLVRWQNGNFRRFNKSDGLSSDFIECLFFADNGALWVGTFGGGLDRFKDGKFAVINRKQGLPNGVIGHIESDDRGYLWMSSYGGILRASERDLNRCADGELAGLQFLSYGISDGLPTLECSEGLQPAGGKTADGRLWFPTAKGLVAVDPAGVKINRLPPPVRIEEIRVDETKFADGNAVGTLKIAPGRHRIEFQYTALSFVAPEKVRFKCRLDNFDTDWADAETKRVATYSYIPPGHYRFLVTACNSDGVWNETSASLDFEVLPHFWQTTWFEVFGGILTVLAASGAVWFETRRRMRRRLERAERQRDIERERSRIARDIHDDLGSHLTRITMMSESARGNLANPGRAAAGLEKIYDTARELTRSMDEIVWAVSPRHDTLESLATYLEKFAQDWLATAGLRCRLDLPLQFPEWPLSSEVRHNVFLALKEALHNAVKHSGASEVLIRLTVKDELFELAVEDNGHGFAVEEKAGGSSSARGRVASGNGLGNMKRRLADIGGKCAIQSEFGLGTKVIFSLPLNGRAPVKSGR